MRVWCLEPVVGFSIWLTDGMKVSPLKDNVLFICCQGNKPFQRKWLFVCVYGPRSICPFGKAHSPPWLKGCTFLTKSNFDGLVRVHHFLDWRRARSGDLRFAICIFFTCVGVQFWCLHLKCDGTQWQRCDVLQKNRVRWRMLFWLIGATNRRVWPKLKWIGNKWKWNWILMFFTTNTWRIWSSLIFEVRLVVVRVCAAAPREGTFSAWAASHLCAIWGTSVTSGTFP